MEHFRHILLFKFNRGAKAAEAPRNICAVHWDNAIGESMARKWFSRFMEDRFDISDIPRSGRPSRFDEDRLNTLIPNDTRQCTRELANVMNCDHSTICDICIQCASFKNRVYGYRMLQAKTTKICGWSYVIYLCLLVIDWLVNNIDHSYPVSLLATRNCVSMLP